MKFALLFIIIILSACTSESPLVSREKDLESRLAMLVASHKVATWKYNAKGAYAIIFDDFCMDGVQGIQNHAAPEAEKRGLTIGFGVVTGFCDEQEWQRAREMIAAGHEVISHSHTHRCGDLRSPWCVDVWSDEDVDKEIDQPAELIYSHTGIRPTFFIFPFDLFTPAKVNHLRHSGYLGTRTGEKQQLTNASFTDPFSQLNFDVNFPPESASSQRYSLNEFVDKAIAEGNLAFREVHGVEDQSWGHLSLDKLRNHFDYVQERIKAQELWMASISNIIRYSQARQLCSMQSGLDPDGAWIQLSGDDPVCRSGTGLSLVFIGTNSLRLKDTKGAFAEEINGTYTLQVGETYRISKW